MIVFKKGDLIIDNTRNLHGIIVATALKSISVKWMNKKKNISNRVHLLTNVFVRQQIMNGNYIYQEREKEK